MNLVKGIKDAVALFRGEEAVYLNPVFRRLFRLRDEYPRLSDIFAPPPPGYGLYETKAQRPDGTQFDAEVVVLPYEGKYQQVLVRDISERQAVEKKWLQSEKLAAMGKLAGEIAHEINNPLGGILLYGNLLKEDLPPESPQFELVEKIIKLATRCRIIAKALLNFGRPEKGLEEWIDLNRVLTDMFSLIEDHRLFRHIEVQWKLESELPLVQGNRSQLEQLVLNLIINAGEALNGNGQLTLRTFYQEEEALVVLEVEDTGPGIPPEILPRIFEPFFTTKTGGKGTGLGLAICHGIVKRHRGQIEVESTIGQGTIFRIKLPRVR
jgi:signal transduction histidine kinase